MIHIEFNVGGRWRFGIGATDSLRWSDIRNLSRDITGIPSAMIDLHYYGEEILDYEADANIEDGDIVDVTWTRIQVHPLHFAAHHGNLGAIRRWVRDGTNVDIRNRTGGTPLMWAAGNGQDLAIRELARLGAEINAHDDSRETALHEAAIGAHILCVEVLIELGIDSTVRNLEGQTALDVARRWNHFEVIATLERNP